MGVKYLWDTNTVIYFLQQQFPPEAEKFVDQTVLESIPAISVITEIELLCWKSPSQKDLEVLHDFIHETRVFDLDTKIKLKTAELRKKHKIKLPDAIIAATAQCYGLTLLTRNTNDFKNIEGLNFVNPHDFQK